MPIRVTGISLCADRDGVALRSLKASCGGRSREQ